MSDDVDTIHNESPESNYVYVSFQNFSIQGYSYRADLPVYTGYSYKINALQTKKVPKELPTVNWYSKGSALVKWRGPQRACAFLSTTALNGMIQTYTDLNGNQPVFADDTNVAYMYSPGVTIGSRVISTQIVVMGAGIQRVGGVKYLKILGTVLPPIGGVSSTTNNQDLIYQILDILTGAVIYSQVIAPPDELAGFYLGGFLQNNRQYLGVYPNQVRTDIARLGFWEFSPSGNSAIFCQGVNTRRDTTVGDAANTYRAYSLTILCDGLGIAACYAETMSRTDPTMGRSTSGADTSSAYDGGPGITRTNTTAKNFTYTAGSNYTGIEIVAQGYLPNGNVTRLTREYSIVCTSNAINQRNGTSGTAVIPDSPSGSGNGYSTIDAVMHAFQSFITSCTAVEYLKLDGVILASSTSTTSIKKISRTDQDDHSRSDATGNTSTTAQSSTFSEEGHALLVSAFAVIDCDLRVGAVLFVKASPLTQTTMGAGSSTTNTQCSVTTTVTDTGCALSAYLYSKGVEYFLGDLATQTSPSSSLPLDRTRTEVGSNFSIGGIEIEYASALSTPILRYYTDHTPSTSLFNFNIGLGNLQGCMVANPKKSIIVVSTWAVTRLNEYVRPPSTVAFNANGDSVDWTPSIGLCTGLTLK